MIQMIMRSLERNFLQRCIRTKVRKQNGVFAADKLPTSILKVQENESMSYMESMEVEEQTIPEILCHLDQNQNQKKLYFEMQYMM